MKKAIINYTKNYWYKITNDKLTLKDILLLAAVIMAISFGIIYVFAGKYIAQAY